MFREKTAGSKEKDNILLQLVNARRHVTD